MGGRERRRNPRFRRRVRVSWGDPGVERTGFTADVGPGGMYIVTDDPELPGQTLELEVELPSGERVGVMARVVRTRRVPRQLRRVEKGGFALQVTTAPEDWYVVLKALTE
jgi:hypothetical protein